MKELSDRELAGLPIDGRPKQTHHLAGLLATADLTPGVNRRHDAQLLFDTPNGFFLRAAAGNADSPDPTSIARSLGKLCT